MYNSEHYDLLKLEHSGRVLRITISRPEQLNCWNLELNSELDSVFAEALKDKSLRVIVLTGEGRAFCTGGDLEEFAEGISKEDPERYMSDVVRQSHDIILAIRRINKPVIAAINGVAAGSGCNLALACDIKIAARSARFSERFVRVGLAPDTGGTAILQNLVGFSRAAELLLTGDFIDAERAEAFGMINQVVDDEKLHMATNQWVEKLLSTPHIALAHAKRLLNSHSFPNLASQLDAEQAAIAATARSHDFRESMNAFFEKRKPKFEA